MKKLDPRLSLTAKARAEALASELAQEPKVQKVRAAAREALVRRQRDLARPRRMSA